MESNFCFADKYYGYDDAPYCAVRLLNILSHSGKSLTELTKHLPKMHNTPEVRFHVPGKAEAPDFSENGAASFVYDGKEIVVLR